MIYFLLDPVAGNLKIGFTKKLADRMTNIQTANANRLELLGCIAGSKATEERLHQRFEVHHYRGEWFRAARPLVEYVRKVAHTEKKFPALVSFDQLVEIEPALIPLYESALAYHDSVDEFFCANDVWYGTTTPGGLKGWLERLVGWDARNKNLRTEEAYDLAYDVIYDALPNCQKCGCL